LSPSVLQPGGRRPRRWIRRLAAGLVLAAGAAVAAYLAFFQSPGNVSHPNVEFTAPKPAPAPKPVSTGTDWPLYGLNPQRTRALDGANLAPPFRSLWSFRARSLIEFQPVLAKGVLFVVENNGKLVALSARSAKIRWRRQIGSLAAASPAWSNGRVYAVGNLAGSAGISSAGVATLWCLDAKTGRVVWRKRLASASESSPLVEGGRVYLGSQDGTVYALNAATGAIRWRWRAAGAVKAGVASWQGRLYVGDYAGDLTALRPGSGSVIWRAGTSGRSFSRSGSFYATPTVAFGRVFAGNTDGFVYSFAARSGQLAWRQSTGGYVYSAPVATAGPGLPPTVFTGSYSGRFYAFDARSGRIRWTYSAGGTISGAASLIGRVVYFSTLSKKTTTGLDARTGRVVWKFPRGAFNPAISDGLRLYITGYSSLYALRPRTAGGAANAKAAKRASRTPRKGHVK
jgi:outer membrane protein assembly factor BamB